MRVDPAQCNRVDLDDEGDEEEVCFEDCVNDVSGLEEEEEDED